MIGYLYLLLDCVLGAYAFVFFKELTGSHETASITLFTFVISVLFFHAVNMHRLRAMYRKVGLGYKNVVYLNIITMVRWLTSFYGLTYIDSATMLCIDMGMIPIAHFFAVTSPKDYKKHMSVLLSILFVLLSMGLIIHQNLVTFDTISSYQNFCIGVFLAMIAGITGAYVGMFSEKLQKGGFAVSEILGTRFYLLLLATLGIAVWTDELSHIELADFKDYGLAALFIVIIPLFVYQKAIVHLGAFTVATYLPLTPIMAYFIELYKGKYDFERSTFIALMICSIAMCAMNIIKHKSLAKVGKIT